MSEGVAQPLTWAQAAHEQLLAHAVRDAPREACGALLGRGRFVSAVVPMTNTHPGNHHYRIDVQETIALLHKYDETMELEVLGWYHSHPQSSSAPSDYDIELAIPGWVYVVVGQDGDLFTFGV